MKKFIIPLIAILTAALLLLGGCGHTLIPPLIDSSETEEGQSPDGKEWDFPESVSPSIEDAATTTLFHHSFSRSHVSKYCGAGFYRLFSLITGLGYDDAGKKYYIYDETGCPYYPAELVETVMLRSLDISAEDLRSVWRYNEALNAYRVAEGLGGGPSSGEVVSTAEADGVVTAKVQLYGEFKSPEGIATVCYRETEWGKQYISCSGIYPAYDLEG